MANWEKYVDVLECALTDAELEAKKDSLVTATAELERLQAEKSAEVAKHSKGIKSKQAEIRALVVAIQSGRETREVECLERRNDRLGQMERVRGDTGEVYDTRPLDFDERQETIPFGGDDELDEAT